MPYIGKSPSQAVRNRYYFTVASGATSVSGSDDNSNTLIFADGTYVDVYLNGVLLVADTDYNTTTANTIAGLSAMSANDVVEVIVYDVFSVFSGNVNSDFSVGGDATVTGTTSLTGKVGIGIATATEMLEIFNNSSPAIQLNDGGDYKSIFRLAGNDLEIRGSSGIMEFYTGNADGDSSTLRMQITSAGLVGIGTTGPLAKLSVGGNSNAQASTGTQVGYFEGAKTSFSSANLKLVQNQLAIADTTSPTTGTGGAITFLGRYDTGSDDVFHGASIEASKTNSTNANYSFDTIFRIRHHNNATMQEHMRLSPDFNSFSIGGSEKMRIFNDGNINVGKTANNVTTAGIALETVGTGGFTRSGGPCVIADRLASDGEVIRISQANNTEGTISVSGSTVSYNSFSGSHWSQLTDGSKPTILQGTVLETIDEMCAWYQAEYTIPEVKYLEGDLNIPEGKSVGDVKEEKIDAKDSIALPDGKNVGDTFTHTVNEIDYTAKIIKEKDNKHVRCKISTTEESTSVYGVFMAWDEDDKTVNDMYVNAVGTTVVRVHKDQTISKGDLLVSNGDGTAKKQDDDIIRSKTIGKALTNIKQETYDDGSYTIPCALYCG